jgi:hypothetical protein
MKEIDSATKTAEGAQPAVPHAVPNLSSSASSQITAVPPAAPKVVKKEILTTASTSSLVDPVEKIDQSIATIMKYRTGGDGGQALKLLNTFIRNIIEHPEDPK